MDRYMSFIRQFTSSLILLLALGSLLFAQAGTTPNTKIQEIDEFDGVPILLKHLPRWEQVREKAVFTTSVEGLVPFFGEQPIFQRMDFIPGTEAVAAQYDEGKLLIIEYSTPQAATLADEAFRSHLAEEPKTPPLMYRRIGNYSVFIFESTEPEAAQKLISEVSYGKTVQWLGEDPFLVQKFERYFALTARDVVVSTILWMFIGGISAVSIGVLAGLMFFRVRENKRKIRRRYSDAGGLTRLNLDDLSEPWPSD